MSSRLTVARRDHRGFARVSVDRSRRIKLMTLQVHVVYGTTYTTDSYISKVGDDLRVSALTTGRRCGTGRADGGRLYCKSKTDKNTEQVPLSKLT